MCSDSFSSYDDFFTVLICLARLVSTSPSASQRLALTSCTTLMICLPAITGKEIPAMTQGQKLSILLARASSLAPALCGDAKSADGAGGDGTPGWDRSWGERIGEEKERR